MSDRISGEYPSPPGKTDSGGDVWSFRLYVAGQTVSCLMALSNLRKLCKHFLPGRHSIEVIDVIDFPERAQEDRVVAIPTVIRISPLPHVRLIGNLSDLREALAALEMPRVAPNGTGAAESRN